MAERCIICTELKDAFNEEHVFPDGIGGHLIINRVCVSCNSTLGSNVDHHLTNHFFMELFRNQYGIRGKTGKVPQVFTHGTLSDDPEQKVHIITSQEGDIERIRLVTKKEILNDGKVVRVTGDGSDEKTLMQSVNKVLKRSKLPEMTIEEFQETLQNETLGPKIKVTVDKDIDYFQYLRAIAKISYELTWYWLGDSYLDDSQAAIIRDFIMNGTPNTSCPFIKFAGLTPAQVKSKLRPNWHQGLLKITPSSISCSVFISDIFYGDFVMSLTPNAYPTGFTAANVVNDLLSGEIHEEFFNE